MLHAFLYGMRRSPVFRRILARMVILLMVLLTLVFMFTTSIIVTFRDGADAGLWAIWSMVFIAFALRVAMTPFIPKRQKRSE